MLVNPLFQHFFSPAPAFAMGARTLSLTAHRPCEVRDGPADFSWARTGVKPGVCDAPLRGFGA